MTTRAYRVCGHCGKSKHASEFSMTTRRGYTRQCDGCIDMIARALKAQEGDPTAVREAPLRNSTTTELYVPPQWGR